MKLPIKVPHGKNRNRTQNKTITNLYLSKTLFERAKNHARQENLRQSKPESSKLTSTLYLSVSVGPT
jgi:hypothetical protein